MSATLSPGLWFCAPQMIVRSPWPSFTLHTDNLSEPGTLSRVRICATTMPSNSPASVCIPSTSRPSIVSRSASSSGGQSKSTYCLSQLRVTFMGNLTAWALASRPRRLAARENVGNRHAAVWKCRVIIFTQQCRDGRRNLALCVGFGFGSFAGGRRVRADHGDPIAFRAGDLFTVLPPLHRPAAATVVGGEDERCPAAVLGHGLDLFPEPSDEIVHVTRGREIVIVAAGVRPFVGLAEADEHQARLFVFKVIRDGVKEERIIGQILPHRSRIAEQVGDPLGRRNLVTPELRLPHRPDWQMAPFDVENVRKGVPRAEHGDVIAEARAAVQPFEYGNVCVRLSVVAVDARIGGAGEDFVVTGVGKFPAVGDGNDAAFVLVAEKLAVFGDSGPEERQQDLASLLGRAPPELGADRVGVLDAAVF